MTRIELHGGRCACSRRFRAAPPEGMLLGTPFGPNIHAVLAYLHHSHHVGFERLARLAGELFGLTISEGAIANALHRLETPLEAERAAIRAKLCSAAVACARKRPPGSMAGCTGIGCSSPPSCAAPRSPRAVRGRWPKR